MNEVQPIIKSKDEFKEIIDKIKSVESAVGIDAQYTHAIIIEYLRQISNRLERIESKLGE